MSAKLKACPFCGARPIVREGKKGHCQLHGDPYQGIKVFCPTSGCAAWAGVETGDIYNGGIEKAKETAIAAWNRRTDLTTPPADYVAGLEAALATAKVYLNGDLGDQYSLDHFIRALATRPASPDTRAVPVWWLRAIVAMHRQMNPMRTADVHKDGCDCYRCVIDNIANAIIGGQDRG